MQCRYCRAWNSAEEHRCTRCGRRLIAAGPRPTLDSYPIQTATAPEMVEVEREAEPVMSRARSGPPRPVYQRSLFREMQQVVSMPALKPEARETSGAQRIRAARKIHVDQQALDFGSQQGRSELEALIYCDAPVALPVHRVMASAVDSSMIVIATAMFLAAFQFGGGIIEVSAQMIPVWLGIAGLLGLFYHLLFAILGGGRTPGMFWTHLELLDFEGRRPNRNQRMNRLFACLLSTCAAGLGLLWALVDEEKLTWHDHISRTFPSPRHREQE